MRTNSVDALSPWALWLAMLALSTGTLLVARDRIDQSHAALTLLLVVLGGSAGGGRALGFTLAILGFVIIDYYFQPPYNQLSVGKALDWVVLLAFLATAFAATELLTRARSEAETARRLAREAEHARELREANRAKDEVLATVSHDLRTPLTTIKLLAQRAAARGEPTAGAIEEQADRLEEFVSNVLDLSRIRAGAIHLDVQLNTAEDLIGAAIDRAAGLLHGRRIVPHINLSEPALAGRFDFVQSLRILGNLLDNGIRHSSPTGSVELEACRSGEWLVFKVSDRGPGVSVQERERIFEPFYRSQPAEARHAGLGLHIARRLAELQGGRLEFRPRDGGGSEFSLWLPAAEVAKQLEPA